MDHLFGDLSTALLRRGYGIRFRATGYSMQPTIEDGEVITVAPITPTGVTRGDILLYRSERGLRAHRVVRMGHSQRRQVYLLRGDASVSCDAPIEPEQVIGRVVAVQRGGRSLDLDTRLARTMYLVRLWAARCEGRLASFIMLLTARRRTGFLSAIP